MRRTAIALTAATAIDLGVFQKFLFRRSPENAIKHAPLDHPEFMYSKLSPELLRQPRDDETFDYIIVGGGGAGCPLARTLADGGFKVALLERGDLRENYPDAWTLHGSGATLMDSRLAQGVVTTDGYITHIGNVLGGGTAVNLGFYIEGDDEEFTNQFKYKGIWDRATRWVRSRIAFPSKIKAGYYQPLKKFVSELAPYETLDLKYEYTRNANWRGASIFNDTDEFRHSADTLLGPISQFPETLILSVNTTVKRVLFERNLETRVLQAKCVEIVTTGKPAKSLLGRREAIVAGLQNQGSLLDWFSWYPSIVKFIGINQDTETSAQRIRTVCLNGQSGSEIIMSAGALLTPDLLYKSGIGPSENTAKLGVTNLLDSIYLGKYLGDRIFLPIALFFQEHVPNMFNPAVLQRIALWEPKPTFNDVGDRRSRFQEETNEESLGTRVTSKLSQLDELLGGVAPRSCEGDVAASHDNNSMTWAEAAAHRGLAPARLIQSLTDTTEDNTLQNRAPPLSGLEELSGGLMATGCSIATRHFFGPLLRSHVVVDMALETLYGCSSHLDFGNQRDFLSLCTLIRPVLDCFKKAAALVYMMPQPKSVGELSIGGPDGRTLLVTGNYLQRDEDKVAGTLGLAAILQALQKTSAFDETFEMINDHATVCPAIMRDTMSKLLFRLTDHLGAYVSLQEAESAVSDMEGETLTIQGEEANPQRPRAGTAHQKFATFPPNLPDPWSYAQVEKFLLRSSTSMWHWHGSARIGLVVDDEFRVAGTERLSIVDASVIGDLTKMNPQVAVMIMGRYAGTLKLLARYRRTN